MSRKNYPARIPRFANGIRSQETRSGSGRSWWAQEWRYRLEGMGLTGRLGRARNYAASGQVIELKIAGPHVSAKVVGTRPDPYDVTIDFRLPDAAAHERLVAEIRREPIFVARLLAGDLPLEIVTAFRREGVDLFPGGKLGPGRYDVTTACSCPDYANPCKHSVAVLLLLGEEIARNPFALLELRGITEGELCDED